MTTPVLQRLRNPLNLRNLRFLLVCACIPRQLFAQTHAFESLTPTLAVTGIIASDAFDDHWSSSPGVAVAVESPFYAGQIELGADQVRFSSRAPGVPGYRSRYVFVGWGMSIAPLPRLALKQGLRLGNYTMHFNQPALPTSTRHESEMAVELVSRVALRAVGRWHLSAAGQYRIVLTEPLIRHLYLSAGLSRPFSSPEWLRDFLD